MLKFEVRINEVWTEINPEYQNFKLIAERDTDDLLIVRYTADGDLLLYGDDYDLLLPFINAYDVEGRIYENETLYNCLLTLSNERNLTTEFINASVTIVDDYYNYDFSNDKNKDVEFEITGNIDSYNVLTPIKGFGGQLATTATAIYSKNGYKFKDILTYLATEIFNVTSIDTNFLDTYFDNVFILDKNEVDDDKDFYATRDRLMSRQYYYTDDYGNEGDSKAFWLELYKDVTEENIFSISFEQLLNNFAKIYNAFWYVKDNVLYFINYNDYTFTNGIDATNYLNRDWTKEALEIVNYKQDKYSLIEFINSDNDYKAYGRVVAENPFYTQTLKFDNIKLSSESRELSWTVNFTAFSNGLFSNLDYLPEYRKYGDWKSNIINDLLINSNSELTEFNFLFYDYLSYQIKNEFESIDIEQQEQFVFPYRFIANDVVFPDFRILDCEFTYVESTGLFSLNFNKYALQSRSVATKWIYLKYNQRVRIRFTKLNFEGAVKVRLYKFVENDDDILVDYFTQEINPTYDRNTLIWGVTEGYFYYVITIESEEEIINAGLAYFQIHTYYHMNEIEATTDSSDGYVSTTHYNTSFSINRALNELKGNLPSETAHLYKNQLNETEDIIDLQKENDKTILLSMPISLNLSNIDFSERIKTHYGWNRLDRVERSYNKDYRSFCNLELSTNVDYVAPYIPSYYYTQFDGLNEYVNCGNDYSLSFDNTDAFSISLFWSSNSLLSTNPIVSKYYYLATPVTGTGYYLYHLADGAITFSLQNNGGTNGFKIDTINSFGANEFRHLMVTYDGLNSASGAHIYVNGVEQAVTSVFDTLTSTIQTTREFEIGGTTVVNGYGDILVDEVSVFNSELTASNAIDISNRGRTNPDLTDFTSLISHWRMGDINPVDIIGVNNGTGVNIDSSNIIEWTE